MLSDKSFNTAKWEAVRSDIFDQISGIAGVFLEHLVYLLGAGGLTNLARSEAGVDDSACCPECSADVWSSTILEGVPIGSIISVGSNYVIVQSVAHPSYGGLIGEIGINTPSADTCCQIIDIEFITGEPYADMIKYHVECGNPVYPASGLSPWDGSSSSNSFQIWKPLSLGGGQFQAKITFA